MTYQQLFLTLRKIEWNDDFTTLTFMLRKGHKWSNGEPFVARDAEFWYEDMMMNPKIREKPYPYLLVGMVSQ